MPYTITKYVPIQGDSPNICSYQIFPLRIYLNSDFYRTFYLYKVPIY